MNASKNGNCALQSRDQVRRSRKGVDTKNVFVMGLDLFNRKLLEATSHEREYAFHGLLDIKEIMEGPDFDINALLDKARSQLHAFPGSVDAIVSYWDFPSVLMLPILRQEFGLGGPSLLSVLKCEHKYWSRLEQQKVIPDHVPDFSLIDVYDPMAVEKVTCPMPFWIKPIKAHSSMLGFRIENAEQLSEALYKIRTNISQFQRPLAALMQYAELPDFIKQSEGNYCIAESIISGECQCTLEGYAYNGTVDIYGVVDSYRGENQSSFELYEYPSQLSEFVQEKMKTLAQTVIAQIGLQNSAFNIEFFYDPHSERISLLEINARISQSHMPLFQKVDGVPHSKVMLDLALGKKPAFQKGNGAFQSAAKFMPRVYGKHPHARITQVPSAETIKGLEKEFPETEIKLNVKEGMKLCDLLQQDSYSYQWATIFMAGENHADLMQKYAKCLEKLDIKWSEPYAEQHTKS